MKNPQIYRILIDYFNKREKAGQHLKSLIQISEIQLDIGSTDYNLPVNELVPIFYGQIHKSKNYSVSFFKVLILHLDPYSDEILIIEKYIEQIEKLERDSIRKKDINNLLQKTRGNSSEQSLSTQQQIKIENDLIVNYDLDEFVFTFKRALKQEGIIAFNIFGDDTILRSYIIKRIKKELQKVQREYYLLDHFLYENKTIEEQINIELKNRYSCDNIADFLNNNQYLDTVFIIRNYSLNKNKLELMANNFLKEIKVKYSCCLDNQCKCLIVLFVNVSHQYNLDGYVPLNFPQKFEIDDLSKWFKRYLIRHQIQEQIIDQYLYQLKVHQGHLIRTYHAFNRIICQLQEGGYIG